MRPGDASGKATLQAFIILSETKSYIHFNSSLIVIKMGEPNLMASFQTHSTPLTLVILTEIHNKDREISIYPYTLQILGHC